MARPVRLLCLLLLPLSSPAQTTSTKPDLTGYVTRLSSPTDFDIGTIRVLTNAETNYGIQDSRRSLSTRTPLPLALGQPVDIFGKLSRKHHTVTANFVFVHPRASLPIPVSGTAIVDLLVPAPASSADRVLRADGYLLRIGPGTALSFVAPLSPASPLSTNLWITYHGTQQPDGTVVLDRAELRSNEVRHTEESLRTGSEYDPAAVDPDTKQGAVSKAFWGVDPQLTPPHPDPVMQARINRIGAALVPAYQRNLPDSDPTKIRFRFQLVDGVKWQDSLTLPSGIILVPYQIVDRLPNDSQLATILADDIATSLEKQTLRSILADRKVAAAEIAATGGSLLVPGLGLATESISIGIGSHLLTLAEQQSGRVSLCLLHDAGYDLAEAPQAWRRIVSADAGDITTSPVPPRSANLYAALYTIWNPTLSAKPAPALTASGSPQP